MATVVKPMIISPIYSRILSKFPQNFTFCFAYGSAVKKQLLAKDKANMIDLIYCVDNPSKWHETNMKENSSHYSGLKYLGHDFIARFQENFGAKVYFNTLVPLEGVWIKYGVVATKDLITDLLEWSDLYLAGRLHKPVEIIKKSSNPELLTALQLNLQSAVHTALLLLPDTFSEYEFYHMVSNISYAGDFRMTFGENKNKVENIVRPQIVGFRNLYGPFLKTLTDYVDFPTLQETDKGNREVSTSCSQDISPLAKLHHLNQLPRWPQKALTRFWNKGALRQDTEDVLRAIAYDPDCDLIVTHCIRDIVFKSSATQSIKSMATAGLLKSIRYSSRKKKMNRYSDSESLDSDEGIRFKTESTRYKQNKNLSSSRSRSRSPRRKDRSRSKVEPAPPPTNVEAIGPQLPPRLLSEKANTSSHFGPQLPPHLGKNDNSTDTNIGPELPPKTRHVSVIGPQLPPHLRQQLEEKATLEEESDEEVYGPLPVGSNFSSTQIALEERALQLKIDQLEPDKNKPPIREEWMLELPEVKASKFGLGPRQFRSKPGPDLSDRSSWTDTPHKKEKKNKVDLKKDAEMKEIRKRDKEQEKISKKLNKNKESLLDLHQSKMSKKKKEEGPSERRPFSRDVDLQVNRFDEAQKKAVLKKAQLLDDRFSSGQSKFL